MPLPRAATEFYSINAVMYSAGAIFPVDVSIVQQTVTITSGNTDNVARSWGGRAHEIYDHQAFGHGQEP